MKIYVTLISVIFSSVTFADSTYDLRMYLMQQESWRLLNELNKPPIDGRAVQNPVDVYLSNLYLKNRAKSIQLNVPQTNPIADPGSWIRVKNSTGNAFFIYAPSIQKVSSNEYTFWFLNDTSKSPYKMTGFDVLILSIAGNETINCSNKKYKNQVHVNYTGPFGTGEISSLSVGEFLGDYPQDPVEIKRVVCPSFKNK